MKRKILALLLGLAILLSGLSVSTVMAVGTAAGEAAEDVTLTSAVEEGRSEAAAPLPVPDTDGAALPDASGEQDEESAPAVTAAPTQQPSPESSGTPELPAEPELSPEPSVGSTTAPSAAPSAEPTAGASDAPSAGPTSGASDAPSAGPTSGASDAPSVEPTSGPSDAPFDGPTSEPSAAPTAAPLTAAISTGVRFVFANENTIHASLTVSGGTAPYTVVYQVYKNSDLYKEETPVVLEGGSDVYDFAPTRFGVHTIRAIVTDADGSTVRASQKVPTAVRRTESEEEWLQSMASVRLTGDWVTDLIAIAETQVGYTESGADFIIDEEGKKHGYTRYGDWYNSRYSEWCGLFVSFCLHYAGIPEEYFPQETNCKSWKHKLLALDAYEDDEDAYIPQAGDLVFSRLFVDESLSVRKANVPLHVGIIIGVHGNTIEVIEGNVDRMVCKNTYSLDDELIVGYANVEKLRLGMLEDTQLSG